MSETVVNLSGVVLSLGLLIGSVIAIRQQPSVASLAMLITAVGLLVISVLGVVVLHMPAYLEQKLETFPFEYIAIISHVMFGISFVAFLLQRTVPRSRNI